jgi:pentatricopeptide repeat protein
MSEIESARKVSLKKLRWRLDPATLSFETTRELQPLKEIIGQERGVEAFRFGINIEKSGYNVFVTGMVGSGRMSTVKKLLEEMSKKDAPPDDLCYVNCFKNPETPILLRFEAGQGLGFKKDMKIFVNRLKKEVPALFESQEFIAAKKQIGEAYEKQAGSFFKDLEQKVKAEGFALVDVQVGQSTRRELMPLVDEKPLPIDQLEALMEKGRFSKEEFEKIREKQGELKAQIDHISIELRDLQREIKEKAEALDRAAFIKLAADVNAPVAEKHDSNAIRQYIEAMIADMADHLDIFNPQQQPAIPGMPATPPDPDRFQPYEVNLLVDNCEQKSPPVIIEGYPTYRNIFGGIERGVADRL